MNNFKKKIIFLPRKLKVTIVLLIDIFLFYFSSFLALSLRFDKFFIDFYNQHIVHIGLLIFIPIFFYTGLYSSIFRYQNFSGLIKICQSIFIYGIIFSILLLFAKISNFPRSFAVIQSLIFLSLISISRVFFVNIYMNFLSSNQNNEEKFKILIYGVNDLSFELANKIGYKFIIGFISEKSKNKVKINNKPIFGIDEIDDVCNSNNISHVIICESGDDLSKYQNLKKIFTKKSVKVRFIDNVANDMFLNTYKSLNEINLDDIIDREIDIDYDLIAQTVKGKRVLITGAGGSIGSELASQIVKLKPSLLILLDNSEFNIYSLEIKLGKSNINQNLIFKLVSITDENELNKVFNNFKPNLVFHAAAYKHVPILETNPISACQNNILGSVNVIKNCYKHKIDKFILISTDKAVRPTNVMGATKRFAEKISMSYANNFKDSNTKVYIVRFGNVIGSAGSVIPLFNEQIKNKETLTITHPDITRYFMKISEAVGLVLLSSTFRTSGNVYFLNMGEPIKIQDIAIKMIKLYGFKVKNHDNETGDIEILYTGLRPGEKMYEELFYSDDVMQTSHNDIFLTNDKYFDYNVSLKLIEKLRVYVSQSLDNNILDILEQNIEGFKNEQKKLSN